MFPANNKSSAQNICFPDICNVPAVPSPIPTPFPDLAVQAQSQGHAMTVNVCGTPAVHMNSQVPLTMGDEAGSASKIKGAGKFTAGNPTVWVEGQMATNLLSPAMGNSAPVGATLVPAAVNVLFARRPDVYSGDARGACGVEPALPPADVATRETRKLNVGTKTRHSTRVDVRRHDVALSPAAHQRLLDALTQIAREDTTLGLMVHVDVEPSDDVRGARVGNGERVKTVRVLQVLPQLWGETAGVEPGDEILAIEHDGVPTPVGALAPSALAEALQATPGDSITLLLGREGVCGPLRVSAPQIRAKRPSVASAMLVSRVGYLRIRTFASDTAALTHGLIAGLETAGARALVLDLRGCPGGLLDGLGDVAGAFLPSGAQVLTLVDLRNDARVAMQAASAAVPCGLPLTVLVDDATASTAEMLAAALQTHGRALLIGEQTHGKGTVQTVLPTCSSAGEFNGAATVTVFETYRPDGARIDGRGVMPDILVEAPRDPIAHVQALATLRSDGAVDDLLDAAEVESMANLVALRAYLRGHDAGDVAIPVATTAQRIATARDLPIGLVLAEVCRALAMRDVDAGRCAVNVPHDPALAIALEQFESDLDAG